MKSTRDESSRILVILDDLDGLDVDHHRTMSRMFAANTLDLIHTAKDPLMAEKDMIWEARDFEVPSLQGEHVAGLLQDCIEDSRRRRNQRKSDSTVQAVSGTDRKIAWEVVKHLGALLVAIIIESHFVKDHFSSNAISKSLKRLLYEWGNGQILQFRRDTYKYSHTILESFEVSKARLRRNINGKLATNLYGLFQKVLQLLSVLRLGSFVREDLDTFCKILSECPRSRPEFPLEVHLRFLGNNFRMMNRCVTELIQVSLLSGPDADDSIKLKSLIMPCALLTPNSISLDE